MFSVSNSSAATIRMIEGAYGYFCTQKFEVIFTTGFLALLNYLLVSLILSPILKLGYYYAFLDLDQYTGSYRISGIFCESVIGAYFLVMIVSVYIYRQELRRYVNEFKDSLNDVVEQGKKNEEKIEEIDNTV